MVTTWHLINIKARTNQTPTHYIKALKDLKEKDPLIEVSKDRCISIMDISSSSENTKGVPSWLIIKLMAYTIIDPKNFYNRKKQENVEMTWDSDVVANKKESEIIFVPSNHTIAVRKSSKISYHQILKYFREGLNEIENDGFDVNIVISKDLLNRIRTAHSIIKINAEISFSNPSHTKLFVKEWDEKVREANPDSMRIELDGTKSSPLKYEEDGLIFAITEMAERDGTINAIIQEDKDGKYERVNSAEHPRILSVELTSRKNFWGDMFNAIRNLFN